MSTIKKCVPFNDARTSGYYIPTPCDIWVENENDIKVNLKWCGKNYELIRTDHPLQQIGKYPIPDHLNKSIIFKWMNPWIIKTTKKWSCFYTHPMHFDDLPFYSLSGIVDTDKFPAAVNFPFFIKKGFKGLIEKGTPMIQVIPFKREKTYSSCYYSNGSHETLWNKACNVMFDRYKKYFHSPKEYSEVQIKKPKCPFGFSS
jgi:hypothetical protein